MILGDPSAAGSQAHGGTTIDDLFRHAAARRPEATALADPPNRASFTDSAPLRLSYAEADRAVSAIAERLRRLGLAADAVVGVQMSSTVESVLAILGVLRAGMIVAPLPLLWRQADVFAALDRIGAKAIVASSRVGDFNPCDMAVQVAAELFAIRHVCGFGPDLPDGVIAFDDVLAGPEFAPPPDLPRDGLPAAHVAAVTFEATPRGLVAVARNHTELIAGGIAALLEGRIGQGSTILGCCALSSFAGLAHTVMPWLMCGGTLLLHHPFDERAFTAQCGADRCGTVVLPGPMASRLADAGLLRHPDLTTVLAVWHAPERVALDAGWDHETIALVDIQVFGEMALVAGRRAMDGGPAIIPLGPVRAPRDAAGAVSVAETARSDAGTLMVRGAMVPRSPFPPGAENGGTPRLGADAAGYVDTGYPCRLDPEMQSLRVTGPPAGIVAVGGYRFRFSELQSLVARAEPGATLGALPDAIAGHRLSGNAADPEVAGAALDALGINPLVGGAFRRARSTTSSS